MIAPRTDVYTALLSWITATHDRAASAGGDECSWSVLCLETGQSLINDMGNCGISHRRPGNAVEAERIVRETIEEDVILQIHRIASALTYHASGCSDAHRRMYGIRPAGPIVVLRRHLDLTRDGTRGDLHLSADAILAAGAAITTARATAPTGQHMGTRGGHRRVILAASWATAA